MASVESVGILVKLFHFLLTLFPGEESNVLISMPLSSALSARELQNANDPRSVGSQNLFNYTARDFQRQIGGR